MDKNILRSRQKISGPLFIKSVKQYPRNIRPSTEASCSPKIPISQSLTHATLQHNISIWPAPKSIPHAAAKARSFSAFSGSNTASAALQYTANQILGVEDLAHLLPDRQKVAGECLPYALIDGVLRCATVLAWDSRCEVATGEVVAAAATRTRRIRFDVAA
jgi:hypothetical protein